MLDNDASFLYNKGMGVKDVSAIRVERARKGLSQDDLAALVGCSRQSISLYESGHVQPSVLLARRIADALGCSLDDLYPSTVASA